MVEPSNFRQRTQELWERQVKDSKDGVNPPPATPYWLCRRHIIPHSSCQMSVHLKLLESWMRGYKEKGNINTPLELAIRNQTDRFSLAIGAIDRIPRFRETGSGIREALLNQQIDCMNHAFEFGVDRQDITDWKWPF